MELLKSFQVSASGMSVERTRLEVISANIANANATRSADGSGPYQRRMPVVEALSFDQMFVGELSKSSDQQVSLPQITDITLDATPGPMVYDPAHPDADPDGYVQMPNVNMVAEMVDMVNASRAYEANLNAIDSARDMAMKSLDIGRG